MADVLTESQSKDNVPAVFNDIVLPKITTLLNSIVEAFEPTTILVEFKPRLICDDVVVNKLAIPAPD